MTKTPICDENYIISEPHGYEVIPLHIGLRLERDLAKSNARIFELEMLLKVEKKKNA